MAWGILPACLVAVVVTCVLAALVVLRAYMVGCVSGDKEMALYPNINYLGVLPDSWKQSEESNVQNIVFEYICKRFQNTGVEHHVVMAGVLPGAKNSDSFFEFIRWNYAMVGKEVLILDVVNARDYMEDHPMQQDTCIVSYDNFQGVLPVENINRLSETELVLLKADLNTLKKKYSLIIIRRTPPLNINPLTVSLFLESIASICDGMLIVVGAKRSKRKDLRALSSFASKSNCQIMTVLSFFSKIEDKIIIESNEYLKSYNSKS